MSLGDLFFGASEKSKSTAFRPEASVIWLIKPRSLIWHRNLDLNLLMTSKVDLAHQMRHTMYGSVTHSNNVATLVLTT